MKNLARAIATLLLLFQMYACQQNPAAPTAATAPEVKVTSQKVEKSAGADAEKAFKFDVSYPVVSGGGADLAKNVQAWAENQLTALVMPEAEASAPAISIDQCLEKFMAAWKENASGGGMVQAYTLEISDTVLYNGPKCLSLRLDSYIFTAGAHGTPVTSIENFDPATGQKIMSSQVVKDQGAILALLDKKYLELKKEAVEPGASPYFDGKISFPQNWAYNDHGLLFHYNAYEIAAYALGDADIFLTWEEMGTAASKL